MSKPLTISELGELLMETTQRDCGVWPEDQPDPGKEENGCQNTGGWKPSGGRSSTTQL